MGLNDVKDIKLFFEISDHPIETILKLKKQLEDFIENKDLGLSSYINTSSLVSSHKSEFKLNNTVEEIGRISNLLYDIKIITMESRVLWSTDYLNQYRLYRDSGIIGINPDATTSVTWDNSGYFIGFDNTVNTQQE